MRSVTVLLVAVVVGVAAIGMLASGALGRSAATSANGPGTIWFRTAKGVEQIAPDGKGRKLAPVQVAPLSVTADGVWMTYYEYDGVFHAYVVKTDGTARRELPGASFAFLSPDGTKLAYRTNTVVVVSAADGSNPKTIASPDQRPVSVRGWSPAGDRIILERYSTGGFDMAAGRELSTVKPDGTDVKVIAQGKCFLSAEWSPDGTKILVSYSGESFCPVTLTPVRLATVPATGGALTEIVIAGTEKNQLTGSYSPDGSQIVLGVRGDKGQLPNELRVVAAGGGATTTLATDGGYGAVWLPSKAAPAAPRACTKKGTVKADRIVGTPKADVLCGLGGNDVLLGKGGNDTLIGGPGKDTLDGGPGRDTAISPAGDKLKSIEVKAPASG